MITKKKIYESMECHRKTSESYTGDSFECGWQCGFASALESVLDQWDEIYQAHRLESAIEDAKERLQDYIANEYEYSLLVLSNLPEKIAMTFLINYDPNIAASDQYDHIISQYDSFIKELLNS